MARQEWEYSVRFLYSTPEGMLEESLASMGLIGWEAFWVRETAGQQPGYQVWFKRPKE